MRTVLYLASAITLLALSSCADQDTTSGGGEGGDGGSTTEGGGGEGVGASAGAPSNGGAGAGGAGPTGGAPQGGGGAAAGGGGEGEGGSGPSTECGNDELEAGEQCDDGNVDPGDGCDASCLFEPTGPDDVCPGVEVELSAVVNDIQTGSVGSSTAGTLGQYDSFCGGSGNDTIYMVTPSVSGQLTATLTSDFDAVLHARSDCAEPAAELDCADDFFLPADQEVVSFEVTAGEPAYIIVDGYGGEEGSFALDISVATAFCGNGIAELPEDCDDGDLDPFDGCAADCTVEPGGDPDDCPGQIFILEDSDPNAVRTLSLLGDTSPLETGISPTSCSGLGKQAIYSIVPDVDGAMTARMVGAFTGATLHVRNECDISSAQLDCVEATDPGQEIEVTVPVFAANTYFVFIDSASSSNSGPFSAEITVTPAFCGNDEVDGGEECDDGNAVTGDGCAPDCTLEVANTSNDICPGAPLVLTGSPPSGVLTASTADLTANYTASGTGCPTSTTSKDAVYAISSPIDGLLTVTVDPAFDAALFVRTNCTSTGTTNLLGCKDALDGNGNETIAVPVVADTIYYVYVDSSLSTQSGVFEIAASVTPGACNNGVLEGAEQCDDGNMLTGDGCDPTCMLEPAGAEDTCPGEALPLVQNGPNYDGSVYSGLSNLASNYTASGCTSSGRDAVYQIVAPMDGVLTATLPVANFNASLHAQTTCGTNSTQQDCSNDNSGNGSETIRFAVTQGVTYYIIIDSTSSTTFGAFELDVRIVPPGCGDGFINGAEACDDANTDAGDGCSPTCEFESLTGNDTCPGYAIALSDPDPLATRTATITTDTSNLGGQLGGTCGGSSRDAVYVVTSDIAGTLSARLTPAPGYAPVLHSRTVCNDVGTQLACDDTTTSGFVNSFPINANTPYYLFVDGLSGQSGVSTLAITVTP